MLMDLNEEWFIFFPPVNTRFVEIVVSVLHLKHYRFHYFKVDLARIFPEFKGFDELEVAAHLVEVFDRETTILVLQGF